MNYKNDVIISQEGLETISKTNKEIYVRAKFGPSQITRMPLLIDEKLSFFVATIIGDGHLRKEKLQTSIECSNKQLIEDIRNICKNLFNKEFNIHTIKIRKGRKQTFSLVMGCKSIYNLLNRVFEIPYGKKSNIVKIPSFILKSNKSIKSAFLIGIMMTE